MLKKLEWRFRHIDWRDVLQFILVCAAAYVYFAAWNDRGEFNIFQERDLARAQQWVAGKPIFFGPELSGGGHLPGPFYYALLYLPLALGWGWQGAQNLMVALTALGAGSFWFFLRRNFGFTAAAFAVIGFVASQV